MYYENYKKIRDSKGVRDVDVAKATGIDQSTFSHWSKNKYTPKENKLKSIADYFGITLSELEVQDISELDSLSASKSHNIFGDIIKKFFGEKK